jgi:hypothetical protein
MLHVSGMWDWEAVEDGWVVRGGGGTGPATAGPVLMLCDCQAAGGLIW